MTQPAESKPLVAGQAVANSMNGSSWGVSSPPASAAEVRALRDAALGNPANFQAAMANNQAWKNLSVTYKLTQADATEFFRRYDVQDVVSDRGLGAIRAVDRTSGEQTVFVSGAEFPGEFLGKGLGETAKYGGSIVQAKALVDAYDRWGREGIDMNGSQAVCHSLGGSTLALAIPNLNVNLESVTCFGGYGVGVAVFIPPAVNAGLHGLPEGFSDLGSYSTFVGNYVDQRNMSGTAITNYMMGQDWIPTYQTQPFGTIVPLKSPIPSPENPVLAALHGVTRDHPLTTYWQGVASAENNPSPAGLTSTTRAWANGFIMEWSNGAMYIRDVVNDVHSLWVPNPAKGVADSYIQKEGVWKHEVVPLGNTGAVLRSEEVTATGPGKFQVVETGDTPSSRVSYSVETFELQRNDTSAGYFGSARTNNATGETVYDIRSTATGEPIASGTSYTVAANGNLAVDVGSTKQVFNLSTGRMIAQVQADGAGFIVGPDGADVFFNPGQLAYNAGTGVVTATSGGTPTPFFETVNAVQITTNTAPSTTGSPTPDATSAPNVDTRTLIFRPDYSLLGVGNVNEVSGASAVANDMGADGLRPGNGNLGLDIDGATGEGLQPPAGGSTDPYALFGSATNTSSAALATWTPVDPLVLDLNGNGVVLTNFTDAPVLFDTDNDGGSLEQTGWVSAQDGIVVHDLNADGRINNIRETLSEYYNGVAGAGGVAGTKPFADGFAALRSLDGNADGSFTSADAAWGNLRVWVDANHDGRTDAGELKSFAELGVTSINLTAIPQSGEVRDGNEVLARGTFVQNGITREAIAANFLANPAGATLTQLPGGLKVTTENAAGAITSYVSQNTNAAVDESLGAQALGAQHVTGGAGDDVVTGDARNNWLAGSAGRDTLAGGAGDDVLLFDAGDRLDGGAGMDIAQVVGDHGVNLNLAQANIEIAVGGDGDDVLVGGGYGSVFVRGGAGDDAITGGAANDVLSGEDGSDVIDGGEGNDLLRGHRGRDQLVGGRGDDVLDGGLEDDTLRGGAGNDVHAGGRGDDSIEGGAGIDVAEFSGSYSDYRITRLTDAAGRTVYRVVDTRTGQDGADTLVDVEKLSFADVSRVELSLGSPLPVRDVLAVNGGGQQLTRSGSHLISKTQLLANDRDWDSDASQLRIFQVLDVRGGTATLTEQGDVLFTPDPAYTGVMSFKYRVKDAQENVTNVSFGAQTEVMKAAVYLQTPDLPADPLAVEQWYLTDVNVIPVWKDYTGKGVRMAQFEPGGPFSTGPEVFDYRHSDLQPNADKAWLNQVAGDPALAVTQTFSNHATMVAGVMVAARNGEGGIGIAHGATLAGHYIQGEGLEVSQLSAEITAALAKFRNYDVVNNSWGPTSDFDLNVVPPGTLETGILNALRSGRGGLGTAIVMAGGNDRARGSNTNYNALTGNRGVITTGSINAPGDLGTLQLGSKPFSNPGASILVSAPGSNIDSTSRQLIGENGSTFGSEYNTSEGTSFAAPIVSGVVALMLEANPNLGYRDIQTILAMTATRVDDPNGTDWVFNGARNWNGGGMHVSHDYGFGKVDARAAVRLAETWNEQRTIHNEQVVSNSATTNAAIPDGAGAYSNTLTMAGGLEVESAQVTVQIDHARWGDLVIRLVSPTGNTSVLMDRPGKAPGSGTGVLGDASSGTLDFSFNTTHVRGEPSAGPWTLQVFDAATGATGTLRNWKLDLYGSTADSDDVYVYTNEFASFAGTARNTLVDSNGGYDALNASAATGNSVINLVSGQTSTIAGKTLTVSGDIERAVGGDGNDTIVGNAVDNVLIGGRGNDSISGGVEDDLLVGGKGADTLSGGSGRDYFIVEREAGAVDTISDFNPNEPGEKILIVGFDNVADFSQLTLTQVGVNTHVSFGGQTIVLLNLAPAQVTEQNFTFLSDTATLDAYMRYAGKPLAFGTSGAESVLMPNTFPGGLAAFLLQGNDTVGAVSFEDLLDGGDGNDLLWGDYPGQTPTPGADWMEGGAGIDEMYGGPGGDRLVGGSGDDILFGEDGNDVLFGGTGADYLDGGGGDDLIALEGDPGTVDGVGGLYAGTRAGGAGADTFRVLAGGGGTAAFQATATQFSAFNMISDFNPAGGDRLDLRGFTGVTSISELRIQNLTVNGVTFTRISPNNGSTDFMITLRGVNSSQVNASHFLLAPATPGLVKGTAGADNLVGDAGANIIDGVAGADTMTGRTGDDTYIVDNAGDVVNELPGGGYDRVESGVSYTLSPDVEALALTGTASNATGNAQRNRLRGNAGANRLDGGAEADEMAGGAGNDTYVVDDQLDTAYESAGEGIDLVESAVSWTLGAHFENLTLTGTANVNATGNEAANALRGNSGDNVLDGAQGADNMAGGAGNDTYFLDSLSDTTTELPGEGFDTVHAAVDLTLAANVEAGVLSGAATTLSGNTLDNSLVGNALANTLSGGAGNDVIDGGAGVDTMIGGAGDDTYVVDGGDTVTENVGEGNDTVVSTVTTTLAPNVENLTLAGTAAITGTGNALHNRMAGNSGANTLTGGDGNDTLDGGGGADALAGGAGNDTYVVDDLADTITEAAAAGADTVASTVSFSIASLANLENVTLDGGANIDATGNAANNLLTGNSGANVLTGGAGNDELRGDRGADALLGGSGNDVYRIGADDGHDVITDGDATSGNLDAIAFDAAVLPAQVAVTRAGQDLVLTVSAAQSVTVRNWFLSTADKVEQVTFTDGTVWSATQLRSLSNLAPTVAAPIPALNATEDSAFSYVVPAGTFADADAAIGDTLRYTATLASGAALPSWLQFNATTRTFSGTPLNANVGTITVKVTATDAVDASISTSFALAVANVNDAPALTGAKATLAAAQEDTAYTITQAALLAGFSDEDGDALSVSGLTASNGTLSAFNAATASWTFTPNANFFGTVSLGYAVADGRGASTAATQGFTVANVNDAPTGAVAIAGSATQGQVLTASHTLADADGLGAIGYQWQSSADGTTWANITGATAATFALTQAQVGRRVRVAAGYTDGGGRAESVASPMTGVVANVNDAPTGGVTVTGTATQGQVLSASHSLSDADGLGTIAWQWQSSIDGTSWTNLTGATAATLTLTQAQVGRRVRAVAGYTDGGGTPESVASTMTTPVANVNDAPVLTGTKATLAAATEDSSYAITEASLLAGFTDADGDALSVAGLTASTGTLAPFDAATRTWTFTPAANYAGPVALNYSVVDPAGAGTAATQSFTVANVNDAPTGGVTVAGTATQGQVLTASHTLADADGLGTIAWQWQTSTDGAAWSNVSGATAASFTLTQAQVGRRLRAVASYADGRGTAESVASAMTAPVANVNDAPTGAVTVTGTASQGQVLTASHTLADADGLGTIAWQWQSSSDGATWANISGATAASLTLTEAQVGRRVRAVAGYTDGGGTPESVASATTTPVANVNDAPTGAVTVAGTAAQGQLLTASSTLADADGLGAIAWQWQSSADGSTWANITGATAAGFTLTQAQVGRRVRAVASYTDGGGTPESMASAMTAAVANVNDAPALTGARATLAAATEDGSCIITQAALLTGFTDADGDSFSVTGLAASTGTLSAFDPVTASWTFTPAPNFFGPVSLAYSVVDSLGAATPATQSFTVTNVNDPVTGAVTVTGTATQGQVLTASHTLADADGLGTLRYQWQSSADGTTWTDIAGATTNTFTLTQAQVGRRVRTVASYTDGGGTAESVASAVTTPVTNVNDAPSGAVTVTGTAGQGQVLTASNTLADADGLGTVRYQWQSSPDGATWANITGATAASFTLTQAQVGRRVRAVASYTDGGGTAESVASAMTAPVMNVNDAPALTGAKATLAAAQEDGSYTITQAALLAGFSDADGDALAVSGLVASTGTLSAFDPVAAAWTFTPAPNFFGPVSLGYSVVDGNGGGTAATQSFTVSNVNDPVTGGVTVTGTATQGQVLTASHTLADADGLGAIAWQWQSSTDGTSWTPIAGATGASFTLAQAQVGRRVRAVASYTDGGGTPESAASAMTTAVANVNDAPTGAVTVTGTATQGQVLTATQTLADADGLGAIAWQWQSSTDGTTWANIGGAAAATFTLTQAQVGRRVRAVAGYTDGGGTAESVSSAMTTPVANVNDAPTGTVTLAGAATQGQVLTVSHTLADADGLGAVAYQWQSSADGATWSNITGATASTFALTQAQVGRRVRAVASYTDGGGMAESVASAMTTPVANVNDAPTGGVTVAGTTTQGQVLAASHTLADADGLGTIGWQWQSSADGTTWSDITGATAASFALTQAQVGRRVRAVAGYTDGGGTAESVASAMTAAVANVNDAPTGAVTVSGTATQGQVLTAANTLADADGLGAIGYQWQSSADGTAWSNITGATASGFTLTQAQVGRRVRAVASYTDGAGTAESIASATTAPVANVNDAPTGAVTVTGNAAPGETLVATQSLADADGLGTLAWQWQSSTDGFTWTNIAGATSTSFLVGAAQSGLQLRASASYLDGGGTQETVNSVAKLPAPIFHGTAAADTLVGTAGNDTLIGHAGDDYYTVNSAADTVVELAGEGSDTVQAHVSFVIPQHVENLFLMGTAAIDGTGNSQSNNLYGNDAANVLDGKGGGDFLSGTGGNDTYVFDRGYGSVGAMDYGGTPGDAVQMGASVRPADVIVRRRSGDLELEIAGTSDRLRLYSWFTGGITYKVEQVRFADGTVWTEQDLVARSNIATDGDDHLTGTTGADAMAGGLGNDTYVVDHAGDVVTELANQGSDVVESSITYTLTDNVEDLNLTGSAAINATGNGLANRMRGNDAANQFDGGAGNDTLLGGSGSDTYLFGRGSGQDAVADYEYLTTPAFVDVVRFGAGVLPSEVTVRRNFNDLVLTINGTTDKLTISSWFSDPSYRIEEVRFADGTVWDPAALVARSNTGTSGDDFLTGSTGADTLVGGLGNDTYTVDHAGDVVTELPNEGTDRVESSIGYTLGANVENLTLTGSAAIDGTGNDLANNLTGNSAANVLDAKGGNDSYSGQGGNDTYLFGRGYGQDYVWDADWVTGNVDTVLLAADVLPANVQVRRSYSDLVLGIAGTTDTLTLSNWFGNDAYRIEQVRFADGTVWDAQALIARSNMGTDGNDSLTGTTGADTLSGGLGNDSYVVDHAGDVVNELANQGSDVVESSITYTLSANVENLRLTGAAAISGSGNELANSIDGNGAANVIDGKAGNDWLYGALGNDTYVFGRGYGQDSVWEYDASVGNTDTVAMAAGVLPSEVQVRRSYSDMVLTIAGTTDRLTLSSWFANGGYRIEQVRFADGTVWDAEALIARSNMGTDGDDFLTGTTGADTLAGGLGNDAYVVDHAGDVVTELAGQGTDRVESSITWTLGANVEDLTLTGAAAANATGNELANRVNGNSAANVLDGKAGADTLSGAQGNDTYLFGRGDGKDVASDYDWVAGNVDVIQMGAGVLPTDVQVRRSSADMYLTIAGTTDELRLSSWFSSDSYRIEQVRFADGTVWDAQAMIARTNVGTSGNDYLTGTTGADTLAGGLGNDSYVVDHAGDVITELPNEGTDRVESSISYTLGANLENLLLIGSVASSGTGNELANTIDGNSAANVIDGKAGNDWLYGASGNDTYVFGRGYGQDSVWEYDNTVGNTDTVAMAAGVLPSEVQVRRNYSDMVLTIAGTTDRLTLSNWFANGGGYRVEQVRFADGTVWDAQALIARSNMGTDGDDFLTGTTGADTLAGGLGNDTYVVDHAGDVVTELANQGYDTVESTIGYTLSANLENLRLTGAAAISGTGNELANTIDGNSAANVLDGKAGNDYLNGGYGDDSYVFGRGAGQDRVSEWDGTAGNVDTVQVAAGVLPSELQVRRSGSDMVLSIPGTTDTMTLASWFAGTQNRVEQVRFADGTLWTADMLVARTNVATDGDDFITGSTGADTMAAGLGNDTYIVDHAGDVVTEQAAQGVDKVESSLTYTLGANVENLTLTGTAALDGTGNELGNVIAGNDAANALDGKGGSDVLQGGRGNDTYRFARGHGQDVVSEFDWTAGNSDTLLFGADIASSQLWFQRSGNNLDVTVIGTGEKVTVSSWYLSGEYYKVEVFRAGDGKTLTHTRVQALVDAMAGFAPPPSGQTTLSPELQAALGPTLAANWL